MGASPSVTGARGHWYTLSEFNEGVPLLAFNSVTVQQEHFLLWSSLIKIFTHSFSVCMCLHGFVCSMYKQVPVEARGH